MFQVYYITWWRTVSDLVSWSITSYLSFNPSKSIHVLFNQTISTSYNISSSPISSTHSHKDLELTISDNLNWNIHHNAILSKAYRTLGLVRRAFSSTIPISAKVILYSSVHHSLNLKYYTVPCMEALLN